MLSCMPRSCDSCARLSAHFIDKVLKALLQSSAVSQSAGLHRLRSAMGSTHSTRCSPFLSRCKLDLLQLLLVRPNPIPVVSGQQAQYAA